MKKFKLTAVLLSLSMALTFMPATVYAEADTADIGGTDVTENEVYEDATAPEAAELPAIEYAALAYPILNIGESQGLVIGMDASGYTGAKITLVSKPTGASSEYDAELINEEGIVFKIPIGAAGEYGFGSLVLTDAYGNVSETYLSDLGMDISFSATEEALDTEAEAGEYEKDIITADISNGADVSSIAGGVKNALSNAGSDFLTTEQTSDGKFVVMLDPGHDASHTGASKNGIREEIYTLKIAQYVAEELSNYPDIIVCSTRNSGACPVGGQPNAICLETRTQMAADAGADVFVSLHLNSGSSGMRGAEVYYPNSNYQPGVGASGQGLASHILSQLGLVGLPTRGTFIRVANTDKYPDGSRADYYSVIRNSKLRGIPGIIVEHAYISNAADAAIITNDEALRQIGIADATGIANYFGVTKEGSTPADPVKVEAFVRRLYRYCLNREPDANGLDYWKEKLMKKESDGANVAFGFFFSDEYKNSKASNDDYVETLYRVMMDRSSDSAGKSDWVGKLNGGTSRESVFKGFADSQEFANICKEYGIKKGTIDAGGTGNGGGNGNNSNSVTPSPTASEGLKAFVSRLYTKALERNYDEEGLYYWCAQITGKYKTIDQVSTDGFFHSKEFLNKNLSNEDYVKVLYHTFFDREPDEAGYNYWLAKLKAGGTRDEVLAGFSGSEEFKILKRSFGIE